MGVDCTIVIEQYATLFRQKPRWSWRAVVPLSLENFHYGCKTRGFKSETKALVAAQAYCDDLKESWVIARKRETNEKTVVNYTPK